MGRTVAKDTAPKRARASSRKVTYSLPAAVAHEVDRRCAGAERGKSRPAPRGPGPARPGAALRRGRPGPPVPGRQRRRPAGLRGARPRGGQGAPVSVRKWDLAWAFLDPTVGHEQAGRRPVLVFCNDVIAGPIGLVTVLPLTTWRTGRRVYPTEVLLPSGTAGLPEASLVLAHQVRTISAGRPPPATGWPSEEGAARRLSPSRSRR